MLTAGNVQIGEQGFSRGPMQARQMVSSVSPMNELQLRASWVADTLKVTAAGQLRRSGIEALRECLRAELLLRRGAGAVVDLRAAVPLMSAVEWVEFKASRCPVLAAIPMAIVVQDCFLAKCDEYSFQVADDGIVRVFVTSLDEGLAWVAWRSVRRSLLRAAAASDSPQQQRGPRQA